jgi:ribosomal protein S18 acetylase RimI-like enzyme
MLLASVSSVQLRQLSDLERACMQEPWTYAQLKSAWQAGDIFVVYDDILAYGSCKVAGQHADINNICVHPFMRRRGRARHILLELVSRCANIGATTIMLEVSALNQPAIALYHSCGFAPVHTRKAYYSDGADALVLKLSIK